MRRIQDVHVLATEPLIAPNLLKNEMPVDEGIARTVVEARETIREILAGRDRRMLCIVGPCSIHDPDAAIDYARRLAKLKDASSDRLYVIMRVYFEKPRTTVGWKGLINDPHMDDSCDMREGLRIARRLLIEINRLGLAAGTELLDPITPQYIADLVAWAAIGARTTESQTHRDGERVVDAGRIQEHDRRKSAGCDQRNSIGAPAAFFSRHHAGRNLGRDSHLGKSRHACRASGRTKAELRRRQYRGMPPDARERRAGAAHDGGLLARADEQGLHQTARGAADADRSGVRRQPRGHGCDAREQYRSR